MEEPVGSWPDVPGRSEALPTWTEREGTVAEGFQTPSRRDSGMESEQRREDPGGRNVALEWQHLDSAAVITACWIHFCCFKLSSLW